MKFDRRAGTALLVLLMAGLAGWGLLRRRRPVIPLGSATGLFRIFLRATATVPGAGPAGLAAAYAVSAQIYVKPVGGGVAGVVGEILAAVVDSCVITLGHRVVGERLRETGSAQSEPVGIKID